MDKVKVPQLPPGDYVVSFRWDSEQTPQVWASCGDVTIQSSGAPSKPFTPYHGCEACCFPGLACGNCSKCADDKTGDCAYCWNKLPGYNPALVPPIYCLGYEAADGGAKDWYPGDARDGGWSPGCTKCWATKGACEPSTRPSA